MRNTILGVVAGLILGMVVALAFSHFTNDALLADLQAKLDAANAALDRANKEKTDLASENNSLSGQVDQLQKGKPQGAATDDPKTAAMPKINPMNLLGLAAGAMRAQQSGPARMFLLKSRLHLKPDQEAAIKKAMDSDEQARRDLFRQAFQNGQRPDMSQLSSINSTATTLAATLDPEQQRQYAQLQTDEKNARADLATTTQIDQMSPLLQLSDSQREQVYNALLPTQLNAPDGPTMMANPQTAVKQANAVNDILSKSLTTDQMSLYTQQGDIVAQNPGPGGGGGGGRRNRGGGGGGGGQGGGGAAAPAAATTGAPNGGAGYAVAPSTGWTGYSPTATTTTTTTTATAPAVAQPTSTTNAAPADTSTNSAGQPSTSATTNAPSSQ